MNTSPVDPDSIVVVIPALNEEAALPGVIRELRARRFTRILVVDNGSTDATPEVAAADGTKVIREPRRGYGRACFSGCLNLPSDADWILFCDADGSDDLDALPAFLEQAGAGADLVLGNRRAFAECRASLTPAQHFGNALSGFLIRLGWGRRFADLGPLRLVRRTLYDRIAMRDRGFGWTVEMQVRAVEEGACIVELPVRYGRRKGGRSKISGTVRGSVKAGTIILSTLGALALRGVGRRQLAAGLLILVGAVLMCPHGEPTTPAGVFSFLAAAGVMGAGFLLATSGTLAVGTGPSLRYFWAVAIAARLLLLPMSPGNDVWRYLWEGGIQWHGHSPYLSPPDSPALESLRAEWWSQINHPDKTAIYPPPLQLLFAGLWRVFGDAILGWKLVFVAADLAIVAMLTRRFGHVRAKLYAWNPLVIYAMAGGAHFESLLLLPLVWAWTRWTTGRRRAAAFAIGLSVSVKWVTAPLLAWIVWRRRRRPHEAFALLALGTLPVALGATWFLLRHGELGPLAPGGFVAQARGMDLLPWLVSFVAPGTLTSNLWIPAMFLPLAGVVLLASRRMIPAFEAYFLVLLACLPSNHAWYFLWLTPWAVATNNLGTRLFSVSAFTYFFVWETLMLTGRWEQTPAQRVLMWAPLTLGLLWSLRSLRTTQAVKMSATESTY